MGNQLGNLRRDFLSGGLSLDDLNPDPLKQTGEWLKAAIDSGEAEPNAMTLATAGPAGFPHARIVLLKEILTDGLVFYTNYESDKGEEMAYCQNVAVLFFWPGLERQIRVEGVVEKVPAEVSDLYFASRPRASQLGAWASPQSRVVPDFAYLENNYAAVLKKFEGREVPRPSHWGGYLIKPRKFEFWQGRAGRLHQRFRYQLSGGAWSIETLAP
ncbi:pyridoxamine 5'-phosphate oxidase [Geofilum rubicundum]|uniref:Pyridoxine/pyridoxamine 5'-phosphate oxidase n=1 Tax=Geofilum rubicundum JCM 15548 TaxID=1236989 RepID=A0A0E9LV65_9BACT|nr:pyridoxamine 5'-phosphate oxidase [Geofilum rubicundum]GAO29198.1 pyridoxamine 5'-phosphate oxidase [Geofilum rubicundum JCM 15548]